MIALAPLLAMKTQAAKPVVAIVGSGGKTSLLWYLAEANRRKKVLASTTTKILLPPSAQYDRLWDGSLLKGNDAQAGITLAVEPLEGAEGKQGPVSADVLEKQACAYDYVVIEADGSRNLPLKGWTKEEPVVPPFTTCTIGVITLWPVGRPISTTIIHRLREFCEISGGQPGEALSLTHVASAVAHPLGLMKAARGQRVLFVNQVEDRQSEDMARAFAHYLPAAFRETLSLVVAASVKTGCGEVLWEEKKGWI